MLAKSPPPPYPRPAFKPCRPRRASVRLAGLYHAPQSAAARESPDPNPASFEPAPTWPGQPVPALSVQLSSALMSTPPTGRSAHNRVRADIAC